MTATPLLRKPTGKLAFAYQTIAALEQARADLEAENKRLREALQKAVDQAIWPSESISNALTEARAALESKP